MKLLNYKILTALVFILVLLGNSTKSQAQSSIWNLTYNMGFSTGEFNQFISKPSFRGFGIEGRGFLIDNLSMGGMFSWSVFAEQTGALESGPTFDVAGLQNRYINAYPINFTTHYYMGEPYGTRVFFGAGLGAYRINQRIEFGLYGFDNNNWHFGFYPEVGVFFPVGNVSSGGFVSLKWHNALANNNADYYSWLSLDIGFSFIN